MAATTSRAVPTIRQELEAWVDRWRYTRFVTLATNDPAIADATLPGSGLKHTFLRERLKKWDAHVNHAILGRLWAERDADRMFAFYFLEKPHSNPHWHGLIHFFADDEPERLRQEKIFDEEAERAWIKLMPSGAVRILPIYEQKGILRYVAKEVRYPLSYASYVTPDEFKRG